MCTRTGVAHPIFSKDSDIPPRPKTQPSPQDKVDTLLLQHSVYGLDRARILRSVVSRAHSFQSLPKAEAPKL